MKNVDIVIAHYNENLNWISQLDLNYINQIWVYTKSSFNDQYISLPNIGRESHTYLYHIVNHYNSLPENIIFLQGDPFNHHESIKPNTIEDINYWLSYIQYNNSTPNSYYNNYDRFLHNGKISDWADQSVDSTGYTIYNWIEKYLLSSSKSGNIYWSAQFGVKSSKILNRDLNFYKILLEQHNHIHPEVSHFLERTWGIIFDI